MNLRLLEATNHPRDSFCNYTIRGNVAHAIHSDGIGSKLMYLFNHTKDDYELIYNTIAQDIIVMNIDDLACAGFLNNYDISLMVNTGKDITHITGYSAFDPVKLVRAAQKYIKRVRGWGVNINLIGGETAVLPWLKGVTVDASVSSFVHKHGLQHINIEKGDVLLGVRSDGVTTYDKQENSGIGCNGISSVMSMFDPTETDNKFILQCLHPTRSYLPFMRALANTPVKGLVHVTGEGHYKFKRFTDIDWVPKDIPIKGKFWQTINEEASKQDYGFTGHSTIIRILNMGYRLQVFAAPQTAEEIQTIAQSLGMTADTLGQVGG